MTRIAFATSADHPVLTSDDALAAEALRVQGVVVEACVWDDPRVEWGAYDAVVIRSCWDYHLRHEQFLDWTAALDRGGVALANSPEAVRWNVEKTYLAELEQQGVAVAPTVWLDKGAETDLGRLLAGRGWDRAVVKPTVSASSFETWVTCRDGAEDGGARITAMLERSGVMVQPFLDAVCGRGEWSFMFFGGAFSHAVLKLPAAGDFRVQSEFGGSSALAEPPPRLLEDARVALAAAPGDPLYARVDGVEADGRLMLLELELIEPVLFFGLAPAAPARFARAIRDRLDAGLAFC